MCSAALERCGGHLGDSRIVEPGLRRHGRRFGERKKHQRGRLKVEQQIGKLAAAGRRRRIDRMLPCRGKPRIARGAARDDDDAPLRRLRSESACDVANESAATDEQYRFPGRHGAA